MARAKEKAAGAESPDLPLYVVRSPVEDGRGRHEEGAIVDFDGAAVGPLLASGAVEPFVDLLADAGSGTEGGANQGDQGGGGQS